MNMFSKATFVALAVCATPALADWRASPQSLGQSGAYNAGFAIVCPGNGTPGPVWGTHIYSSDSSICAAALHDGWFVPGTAVVINYQILPGQQSYQGTIANGIQSMNWGQWGSSFRIYGAAVY